MRPPIEYDPRYEVPEADEGDTQAELLDVLHAIADTTFKDTGQPLRSVHAKSHGLLRAELRVLPDLPSVLAQGLLATPASYPVVMRLSTTPGDVLEDSVSTPRGVALKVIGAQGPRLPGSEDDATQDFVLVNGTTFLNAGPKAFLGGLKMLAATTDKAPALKKMLSAALRQVERAIEKAGTDSAALKGMGGQPATHPLGDSYYSQVPILFGPYMAKVALVPTAVGLTTLKDAPVDYSADPDVLRKVVSDHFAVQGGEWDLRVQFCTNIEEMPIEDASSEWSEELSPYVTVARLIAPPQIGWSEALSAAIDECMSFSPWHGLAAHRPLGAVNRVRKAAYEMSSKLRARRRGAPIVEPVSLDGLPFDQAGTGHAAAALLDTEPVAPR
ncbi:catalase family protein [Pseudoduganella lutea]|uniref:catalase family protein n=1 Tax=Pseudoduganella lutea TaxID=321985 RepID=UPI001A923E70|nr:catalase family protein [Pseudoduganella lutea]